MKKRPDLKQPALIPAVTFFSIFWTPLQLPSEPSLVVLLPWRRILVLKFLSPRLLSPQSLLQLLYLVPFIFNVGPSAAFHQTPFLVLNGLVLYSLLRSLSVIAKLSFQQRECLFKPVDIYDIRLALFAHIINYKSKDTTDLSLRDMELSISNFST